MLSREEMIENLKEFYSLYKDRLIKNNDGGMKSPHMFHAWLIIKKMQPDFIIESGVWRGLGTWFFRKAAPNAKFVCIDPVPQNRQYTDDNAVYVCTDFLQIDWSQVPKENTLVFFDDHQNFFNRLIYANDQGFKFLMSEDNYPADQGDCYTPKKILSGSPYVIDMAGKREYFSPNPEHLRLFESIVKEYHEMPPIFAPEMTRWGNRWSSYSTPAPLLSNDQMKEYPTFFQESSDYTWICYMEL